MEENSKGMNADIKEEKLKSTDNHRNDSVDADVNINVLNKGKSTETESTMIECANTVLTLGNILSILVALGYIIVGLISASELDSSEGLWPFIVNIVYAIVLLVVIRLLAKLIWGCVMLFINMSTALKRIEIKLNQLENKETSDKK